MGGGPGAGRGGGGPPFHRAAEQACPRFECICVWEAAQRRRGLPAQPSMHSAHSSVSPLTIGGFYWKGKNDRCADDGGPAVQIPKFLYSNLYCPAAIWACWADDPRFERAVSCGRKRSYELRPLSGPFKPGVFWPASVMPGRVRDRCTSW